MAPDVFIAPTLLDQSLRIFATLLLAGAIGFEREIREKSAGLKTHMMVGVGACLFTLLTIILIERYQSDMIRADPIRIVSAITAGVAFLAAGIVIQSRGRIRGLTTGGSLWMAGAVGLAAGLGEFALAALAVAATLIVLFAVKFVEHRIFPHRRERRSRTWQPRPRRRR